MSGQMGNTLLVTGVGREDKGMYQCMVRRQEGDTFQAVAELQLGGTLNILSICIDGGIDGEEENLKLDLVASRRRCCQILEMVSSLT